MNDEQLRQMDAFVDLISNLKEVMGKSGDATGAFGRTLTDAEKQLRKLENSFKQGQQGIADLAASIKDGSAHVLDSLGQFRQLQSQLARSGKAIDAETLARIKSIRHQAIGASVVEGLTTSLQSATTAMIDLAIENFKTFVSELQGSGNAFGMVTMMAKQSIDATNKMSQAVASGGESVGAVLTAVLPGYFKLLGVAVMGLAKLFGYTAEKTADLAKFGLETLNTEVQKTMKSYQVSTKAGIFFANGMTEMAKTAHEAGVSYRDFMEAVSKSSTDLTLLGGNAGAGAVAVSKTFKALEPFRRGLLNIGAGMEEQIQGTAEYMANLAQSNQLKGKSDAELAKGVDAYITNLKVISSITGEEAKAAQSRARKASEQSAVQNTLNNLEGDARNKFLTGIKLLPTGMDAALQQVLVSGTITSTELAIAADQIPGLRTQIEQLASGIKNSNVTNEQVNQNYLNNLNDPSLTQGFDRFAGGVGLAGVLLNKFGTETNAASQYQRQYNQVRNGEALDAGKRVDATKNTNNELTNTISDVTIQFNKLQASIEKDLQEPMKRYADFVAAQMKDFAKKIAEIMGILGVRPAGPEVAGPQTPQTQAAAATQLAAQAAAAGSPQAQTLAADAVQKQFAANADKQREIAQRKRMRNRIGNAEESNRSSSPVPSLGSDYQPPEMSGVTMYADGGITKGPSIAGEAGPEAVIPLKNGSIPLDLNLGEMIAVLREQTELSRDLVDHMRDSKDIQQKILYATA